MAFQNIFLDTRMRTAAVLVPAIGIMLWIASQLASEEFLVPLGILAVFLTLVVFTIFVKTIRFETVVLCLLLVGYVVGNRGFAQLSPFRPFFPGEIGMIVIIAFMLMRFGLTREIPDFGGWTARVIIIYCVAGAVRLLSDYSVYRLDAVRDSAMVYYSIYYFFGRHLISDTASKVILERCLKFAFVALVPISSVERFLPDLLLNNGGFGLFYQKDDLMTTFAAMGAFYLYTRPKIFYFTWMRGAMILYFLAFVATGIGRAALGAIVVGTIVMLLAGKKRFLLYPAVAVVLGLTVLGGIVISFGSSQTSSALAFKDKIISMLDVTGSNSNFSSDYGALKAGTNDFRRKLWATFIDETNEYSPTFGRGFGYDFITRFEQSYGLGEFEGLRSAHNFYITLYGRMGLVGVAIFAVLTTMIGVGTVRAALAVRHGWMPLADLGYWCGTVVILFASIVGVVLEGPVGAIVFWIFLSVSVKSLEAARRQRALASARMEPFPTFAALPEQRQVAQV